MSTENTITISVSEMIGIRCLQRDIALTNWAITFAKEFKDPAIVDMDKYRASQLELAAKYEQEAAKLANRKEVQIQHRANGYLRAMKGAHRRSYTMGLVATFD